MACRWPEPKHQTSFTFITARDIQVELIDEQGPVVQHQSKPLEGFERDRSRLIRRDGLRHHVVWQHDGGDKTLADAAAVQPLVIRFILKGGKLFAFRIAD